MEANPTTAFTARVYAKRLGITRQAVAAALQKSDVQPCGSKRVSGQPADVYEFAELPRDMREKLNECARREQFRNAIDLLNSPFTDWKPRDENGKEILLSEISEQAEADAKRLQRALMPSLLRLHDGTQGTEYERLGMEDYRLEHGHTHRISNGHFRKLMAMVRERAGVAEDWSRWEFFLTGKIARTGRVASDSLEADLSELTGKLKECEKPGPLTFDEHKGIMSTAFEEHERLIAEGWTEVAAGRAIRDCLAASTAFRDVTRDALRMQINRYFAKRRAQGRDIADADGRDDNGDPLIISQDDKDALVTVSGHNHRGQLAGAVRALIPDDGVVVRHKGVSRTYRWSGEMRNRYKHVLDTRGYAPSALAKQCGYEAWCYWMYGLDKFDELTASILRDWQKLPSLRVYSADDLTPCVYFYVPNERGWFSLVRGQLLVFEDLRSGMILGYSLQPERNYNSLVIRSLCTYVFAKYGVPSGLYFENGQWRTARLLKGSKNTLSHAEMTNGLERLGVRFTHTKHAWSKPIEKSFDLLQTLMQAEPGYCGRDERYDLPPEMKRAKELVSRKKNPVHPKEFGLHTFETWSARIGELCQQYNNTPQHGRRCNKKTPAQVCDERIDRADPNMTFTADVLHVIAQHREPRRVWADGINFKVGTRPFSYYGPELSPFNGQTLMTGFDPENPDTLTVEDPRTGRAFCVSAPTEVSPVEGLLDPNGNALATAHARVAGQVAPMLTYFKALDCQFKLPERQPVADALTIENGRIIRQSQERSAQKKVQQKRAVDFATETGFPVSASAGTTREDIDLISDFLNEGKKL